MTVTGGGTATGGAEPFGHGARDGMAREAAAGRWAKGDVRSSNGTVRPQDTPAPTGPAAMDNGNFQFIVTNQRAGSGDLYTQRPTDRPAPTITTVTRSFRLSNDAVNPVLSPGVKGGNMATHPTAAAREGWEFERPATTVAGDPRIGGPGRRERDQGERQYGPQSRRVTVAEAACLQTFPVGFPWDGLALADHVVRAGFPVVPDHAQADELVRDALERGVRFTVLGGGREDSEVLDGVVRPVSVDVVNDLTRLRFGDNAVLRHASSPANDGVPPADVCGTISTLVRVERVTRQSPLLPVPGAEATGDGFAFTVVARRLGGIGELISCPPASHPLVVQEAQPFRRVLPAATFDLADSHFSSVAERVARRVTTQTKQFEQVGNAVPPLLAACLLSWLVWGHL